MLKSDRNLTLGRQPAAVGYEWWRGALAGVVAGATFALTIAFVLPRSSGVPAASGASVKPATNEAPALVNEPALEGIAKREVLVLPPVLGAADSPSGPLASEPVAPSSAEPSAPAEPSAAEDDSPGDLQNCVGCAIPYGYGSAILADSNARQDTSSDAQAPDAAQAAEVAQPPNVIVEPPPVVYFASGAPAPFSSPWGPPANAFPPGRLGTIAPGFLGTIHDPAFGGMPHR